MRMSLKGNQVKEVEISQGMISFYFTFFFCRTIKMQIRFYCVIGAIKCDQSRADSIKQEENVVYTHRSVDLSDRNLPIIVVKGK